MFMKSFGLIAPVAIGGLYVTGAFGGGYEREVGRSPAQVMAAVGDLDLTEQPGSPGTDPSRSGGVLPTFVLERGTDTMTWKVMSGTLVATSMTAKFEPLDGGTKTRVTTSVTRGNAPDDLVSPAFRSKSVTHGLFVMALEGELDEMTLPAGGLPKDCQAVFEQAQNKIIEAADAGSERSDESSLANGAKTIMEVNALRMKLRVGGCETNGGSGLQPVQNSMGAAKERPGEDGTSESPRFEPGKPMIDLSENGRR